MRPGDILLPARYGESLRVRPRWLAAFAILSALHLLLGILLADGRIEATAAQLPPGASSAGRAEAGRMLGDATAIRSLFLPVRLFAGWSLYALGLLYACRIWTSGSNVRFAQVFGAAVYAEGFLFLAKVVAAVAAPAGGRPAVPWVPGGLDLLVPSADFTIRYALNSVNVFSAGYVALLTVALAGATGLTRPKAAASSSLAWAASIAVNAAVIQALRTEFHFPL